MNERPREVRRGVERQRRSRLKNQLTIMQTDSETLNHIHWPSFSNCNSRSNITSSLIVISYWNQIISMATGWLRCEIDSECCCCFLHRSFRLLFVSFSLDACYSRLCVCLSVNANCNIFTLCVAIELISMMMYTVCVCLCVRCWLGNQLYTWS